MPKVWGLWEQVESGLRARGIGCELCGTWCRLCCRGAVEQVLVFGCLGILALAQCLVGVEDLALGSKE